MDGFRGGSLCFSHAPYLAESGSSISSKPGAAFDPSRYSESHPCARVRPVPGSVTISPFSHLRARQFDQVTKSGSPCTCTASLPSHPGSLDSR